MSRNRFLAPCLAALLALATAAPCQAQWAGLLEDLAKGATKVGGKAERGATKVAGATAGTLGKAEMLALASGLGAGVVYVDIRGGDVLFDTLHGAAKLVGKRTDDLSDAVRAFAHDVHDAKFVMSRQGALALGDGLASLADNGAVYVVDPVLGPLRVIARTAGGVATYFTALRPGLLIELATELPPEVAEMLAAPARLEDIVVAPVLSRADLDSVVRLAGAAGDRLVGAEILERAVGARSFKPFQGKTLVVVGHIEDGRFVARGADGGVAYAVRIDELEALAEASDVNIIAAGCSSYCEGGRIGFVEPVTDLDVASSIAQMLAAKDQGSMLAAFGARTPLVISQASLEKFAASRALELEALASLRVPIREGGRSLRVTSRFRAARPLPEYVEFGRNWYVLGLIGLAAMFRRNRTAFLRTFPTIPTSELPAQRTRHHVLLVASWLLFLLVSPVFMGLILVLALFGGWPHRQEVLDFCWSFIRRPFSGLAKLVLVALAMAVMCIVYGVLIVALALPGMILCMSAIRGELTTIAWLDTLLCLGYAALALWAGMKAHRWLNRRLDGAASPNPPTPSQATPP